MKLTHILTIIFLSAGSLFADAQTTATESAHAKAHKQLLANAKSRLDKSTIQDFIRNDVDRREQEAVAKNSLSAESSQMVQDLLKEAKTHMGKRYSSGSKGPNAFDCSGFSSYVYRQFGYNLSSSSSAQYYDGEEVKKNDLRPGDLVFFKGRSRNGGVGHVGIIVNVDNEKGTFNFIHASTSKGIRIDNNTDPYYSARYVGARRIITE